MPDPEETRAPQPEPQPVTEPEYPDAPEPEQTAETPPADDARSAVAEAHPTAQVIDLDAVRSDERRATLAYVSEVHEVCALAGRGDLAAGFIAKAAPVADVRRALLDARVAEDEATARPGARARGRAGAARDRHRGDLRRPQPERPIGGFHARAY
jgi:hypothetical protein